MANTWNAASASYNDVADWLMPAGAYYSLVANGDTVVIPADTKTWSSQMTCDKAITIKGGAYSVDGDGVPSSCSTVINNGYGSMFVWTGVANGTHRLQGIEFADGGGGTVVDCISLRGSNAGTTNWRIDHCRFNEMNGTQVAFENIIGVFDHNYVKYDSSSDQVPLRIYNGIWDEPAAVGEGTVGDGSWYAASNLGGAGQLYIEQNTFYADATTPQTCRGMTDGWKGCRFVARYNRTTRGQFSVHGTESPGRNRGSRQIEVYRNTIVGADDTDFDAVVDVRSGLSMVWDNTTTHFATPTINLTADRMFYPFAPWYTADGRNRFDSNSGGGSAYDSGTASSGPSGQTLVDSAKSWSDDQYNAYSVVKTSGTSQTQVASVITDTEDAANRITFANTGSFGGTAMTFTTGDGYAIYKVDQALDAPGRAGGALLFHQRASSLVRSGVGNTTETLTSNATWASLGVSTGDYLCIFNANDLSSNTCFGTFQITTTGASTCTYTVASDAGQNYGNEVYFMKVPSSNTQTTEACYEWNNTASDLGGALIHHSPAVPNIRANEHYYDYTTGFDGTVGVGRGPLASRPATCTTGVAYWATDQGTWNQSSDGLGSGLLYKATATNTWTLYYEPYTYPHPLTQESPVVGTASYPQQTPPTPYGPRGGRVIMT